MPRQVRYRRHGLTEQKHKRGPRGFWQGAASRMSPLAASKSGTVETPPPHPTLSPDGGEGLFGQPFEHEFLHAVALGFARYDVALWVHVQAVQVEELARFAARAA